MNDVSNAKQQIVDRIKNSTNILVTVSRDPSVDELAAAMAVTSFLNKLKKHATAVVSGNIPPAINFLEPDKTFENTVDSLRDFIIALNKEKADHLRYKVEGDVVKIFITPYRTTITSDDLDFSQGDYNVELILALGVSSEEHLDLALEAHGRILHDATVATITAGDVTSNLGSIDWHDDNASSVSEMLIGLTEALKNESAQLDEQIATALLTGIVAATNRFSNDRTSSRVMTMAAQLMAAGANQQLIAARLEEASAISTPASSSTIDAMPAADNGDGTTELNEGESTKLDRSQNGQNGQNGQGQSKRSRRSKQKKNNNGELTISHERRGDLDEISRLVADERQAEAAKEAESKLAEQLQRQAPALPNVPTVADLQQDIQSANQTVAEAVAPEQSFTPQEEAPVNAMVTEAVLPPLPPQPTIEPVQVPLSPVVPMVEPTPAPESQIQMQPQPLGPSPMAPEPQMSNEPQFAPMPEGMKDEPKFGGTLNATTEQAADDKRREEARDRNKTILSHGEYISSGQPSFSSPINSANNNEEGVVDPFSGIPADAKPKVAGFEMPATAPTAHANPIEEPTYPTLADIDAENRTAAANEPHDEARAEVEAAFNNASEGLSFEEAPAPQFTPPEPPVAPAADLPPLPDFSSLPPLPSEPSFDQPASQPANDPFTQMPPLPQQNAPQQPSSAPETPILQAPPAASNQAPSPTQFRIPGQ